MLSALQARCRTGSKGWGFPTLLKVCDLLAMLSVLHCTALRSTSCTPSFACPCTFALARFSLQVANLATALDTLCSSLGVSRDAALDLLIRQPALGFDMTPASITMRLEALAKVFEVRQRLEGVRDAALSKGKACTGLQGSRR